jgi:hypothetical protein
MLIRRMEELQREVDLLRRELAALRAERGDRPRGDAFPGLRGRPDGGFGRGPDGQPGRPLLERRREGSPDRPPLRDELRRRIEERDGIRRDGDREERREIRRDDPPRRDGDGEANRDREVKRDGDARPDGDRPREVRPDSPERKDKEKE